MVFFTLFSCEKESSPLYPLEKAPDDAVTSSVLSIDDAEREVLSFIQMIDPLTRSGEPIRKIANRYSIGGFGITKADRDIEDAPFLHVFNFEDENGYAIVSGDRRVSPILCITDSGSLFENKVIDNPGLLIALTEIDTYYRLMTGLPVTDSEGNVVEASQYIQELRVDPSRPLLPYPDEPGHSYVYGDWEDYTTVGSVLPCKWNQTSPFNGNCTTKDGSPAYVGCVAVAVGQVMYHWKKNTTYKGTYWDWTKMKQIVDRYSVPTYSDAWSLVKKLLYTLGLSENLDMSYGAVSDGEGSGAPVSNVRRTFEHFGYTSGGSFQNYDISTLKTNLAYGPAVGVGYAFKTVKTYEILGFKVGQKTTYSEGHAWVYDQVLVQRRQVKEYNNGFLSNTYYETRNLVHVNWGWGGIDDGYYIYSRFDTNSGPVLTKSSTTTGISGYYQYELEMNCGIRAE